MGFSPWKKVGSDISSTSQKLFHEVIHLSSFRTLEADPHKTVALGFTYAEEFLKQSGVHPAWQGYGVMQFSFCQGCSNGLNSMQRFHPLCHQCASLLAVDRDDPHPRLEVQSGANSRKPQKKLLKIQKLT